MSTPELRELLDEEGVEVGRFVSIEPGRARVEIVTRDRAWWVTVVDREK